MYYLQIDPYLWHIGNAHAITVVTSCTSKVGSGFDSAKQQEGCGVTRAAVVSTKQSEGPVNGVHHKSACCS